MTYPEDRAFVVQFSGDTDPTVERMIGRAEHIESGKKCRFTSLEELEAFMKRVLTARAVAGRRHGRAEINEIKRSLRE